MAIPYQFSLLFFAPLALSVRPLEENAGYTPALQHQHEKRSASHQDDLRLVVGVTPKSALISVSTAKNRSALSSQVASTRNRSMVATTRGRSSAHIGAADSSENWITDEWLQVLFEGIDSDGDGSILSEDWGSHVHGKWEEFMWEGALNHRLDGKVDLKEFKEQWSGAVTQAFNKMGGGDDGKIDKKDVDGFFVPAVPYEIKFAKDQFMQDGSISRQEFEQFLFTVMLFRCIDEDGDGKAEWKELAKNSQISGKFGDRTQFKDTFGDDMDLQELYDFLKKKCAFVAFPCAGVGALSVGVAMLIMLSSWLSQS